MGVNGKILKCAISWKWLIVEQNGWKFGNHGPMYCICTAESFSCLIIEFSLLCHSAHKRVFSETIKRITATFCGRVAVYHMPRTFLNFNIFFFRFLNMRGKILKRYSYSYVSCNDLVTPPTVMIFVTILTKVTYRGIGILKFRIKKIEIYHCAQREAKTCKHLGNR